MRLVSMELRNLIDREDILLDSHKLEDFNDRDILRNKIDKVRDKFIDEITVNDESYWFSNFNKINLIYKFAENVKNTLDV